MAEPADDLFDDFERGSIGAAYSTFSPTEGNYTISGSSDLSNGNAGAYTGTYRTGFSIQRPCEFWTYIDSAIADTTFYYGIWLLDTPGLSSYDGYKIGTDTADNPETLHLYETTGAFDTEIGTPYAPTGGMNTLDRICLQLTATDVILWTDEGSGWLERDSVEETTHALDFMLVSDAFHTTPGGVLMEEWHAREIPVPYQGAYPDSDITTHGDVTATPYWSKVDDDTEDSGSDADYIEGSATASGAAIRLGFENLVDPGVDTNHRIRFRRGRASGSTQYDIAMKLYQGSTLISDLGSFSLGTVIVGDANIPEAEAANITDYTDLRVDLAFTAGAGATPQFGSTGVAAGATTLTAVISGNITPATPSGIAANDILIMRVFTNQSNTFPTISGWTKIAAMTTESNANGSHATYWRRATGSGDIPTFTIAGGTALGTNNGLYARMYRYTGCITSGDPFEGATKQDGLTTAGTTVTAPAVTTTGPNRLIVHFTVQDDDNTWSSGMPPSGYTNNGGLARNTTGGDAGMDACAIPRASAGTQASVTAGVQSASDFWAVASLALIPATPTTVGRVYAIEIRIPETSGPTLYQRSIPATATLTGAMSKKFTLATQARSFTLTAAMVRRQFQAEGVGATLTAAVALVRSYPRSLPLTTTLTPAMVRVAKYLRRADAALTLTPAMTRVAKFFRSMPGAITFTANMVKVSLRKIALPVTATLTAAMNASRFQQRNMPVTATLTPTIATKPGKLMAVGITLTSALNRLLLLKRPMAGSVTLSAALSRVLSAPRSLPVTVTLTPTAVGLKSRFIALPQNLTLAATFVRLPKYFMSQAITFTGNMAIFKKFFRSMPLTVTLTAAMTKFTTRPRTLSQGITFTPNMTRLAKRFVSLPLGITLTPVMNRLLLLKRTMAQTLTLTPSMQGGGATTRNMPVAINFTAGMSRYVFGTRLLAVNMTVAPTITRLAKRVRQFDAALNLTPAQRIKVNYYYALALDLVPDFYKRMFKVEAGIITFTPNMTWALPSKEQVFNVTINFSVGFFQRLFRFKDTGVRIGIAAAKLLRAGIPKGILGKSGIDDPPDMKGGM